MGPCSTLKERHRRPLKINIFRVKCWNFSTRLPLSHAGHMDGTRTSHHHSRSRRTIAVLSLQGFAYSNGLCVFCHCTLLVLQMMLQRVLLRQLSPSDLVLIHADDDDYEDPDELYEAVVHQNPFHYSSKIHIPFLFPSYFSQHFKDPPSTFCI